MTLRSFPGLLGGFLVLIGLPLSAQTPDSRTSALVEYGVVAFEALEPWHLLSLEVQRRGRPGSLIVRGNLARRFDEVGQQLELDAYPRLGSGTYAYLSGGYSPSGLFPELRYAAELFRTLPGGVEASLGVRRMHFESTDVTLLTGTVGLYRGEYYASLRPMISRSDDTGVSASLLVRRYFGVPESYVGLRISGGRSPGEEATALDLERLTSVSARLEGRRPLGGRWGARWSIGGEREELPAGRERRRIALSLGLEARL